MHIRATQNASDQDWLTLREGFIPELDRAGHEAFLRGFARDSADFVALVASSADSPAIGFAELSVRKDYVNGCRHRPVLFLEGIYVDPTARGQGVARALCAAAEAWGRERGCHEFASDVYIDDDDSLAAHVGLGFAETERVVYFMKPISTLPEAKEPGTP